MRKNKGLFVIVSSVLFIGACFAFLSVNATTTATTTATVLTSEKAFKIFYDALGNRKSLLNANNKSGYQGAYDYITMEIGTTTIANEAILSSTSTGAREKLDWFKIKFLENTNNKNGGLNSRDKEGIKQAIIARYNDICFAGAKKNVSAFLKWFPAILTVPQTAKKAAIKTCETKFNNEVKTLDSNIKEYSMEVAKIDKEVCINSAYSAYSAAIKTEITTSATSTAVSASSTACMIDGRVTAWWAQQ